MDVAWLIGVLCLVMAPVVPLLKKNDPKAGHLSAELSERTPKWRIAVEKSSIESCGRWRGRRFIVLITLFVCLLAAASAVSPAPLFAGVFVASPSGSDVDSPASGNYHTIMPSVRPGAAAQLSPNDILVTGPMYGKAPFTVGFSVGLGSSQGWTSPWDFGDGTVVSLPPGSFIPHTYQEPGVYQCWGMVMTADGRWLTLLTMIIVQPY
jgi:PKD domain